MKREAKIAVLIPCYNESATVAKVVTDFKKALPMADVYVYDNNSSDNTTELARAAGAIVRKETQQGKGNVIRSMFRQVEADCYIMVDGDDTYPAENAAEMAKLILEQGADMVIGDRLTSTYFTENKRLFHNTGNVLVRNLVNFFFRGNITDIMTGYRAFSPIFVKSFPVLSKGFEIETEMSIHALDKNLHLAAVSVEYRDRPAGSESKLNTVRDGIKVLWAIFRLYKNYRPFPFFGVLALLLLVLATGVTIPILIEFWKTGLVPKFPTLIVAAAVGIAALQSFFSGLILDTEAKKSRQNMELQMNIIQMLHDNKQ